ncbi:hypothetical protein HKD37_18G051399 [Glycine soja]
MQDKIECNNINEIREEINADSIYIGSATSRAYVQSSSNPLEIFTNFVKILFTTSEHPRNPFPLCSGNFTIQETTSLLIITNFLMNRKISLL